MDLGGRVRRRGEREREREGTGMNSALGEGRDASFRFFSIFFFTCIFPWWWLQWMQWLHETHGWQYGKSFFNSRSGVQKSRGGDGLADGRAMKTRRGCVAGGQRFRGGGLVGGG